MTTFRPFVLTSVLAHGAIVTAMLVLAGISGKPKVGYYAVDMFTSMPAGAPGGGAIATPEPEPPAAKAEPTPPPVKAPEPVAAPKDSIKVPTKEKLKPAPKTPPKAAPPKPQVVKRSAALDAAMRAMAGPGSGAGSGQATSGSGAGLGGTGGAGIVGQAGNAFPFPWYMKAIADKLDKQWNPTSYDPNTSCQVRFTIHRNGQVTGQKLEKSSGDKIFDELALRAVLYAIPLPPLPDGYPEDTLNVYMTFIGK